MYCCYLFSSCFEDLPRPASDSVYKRDILAFLDDHHDGISNEQIDELKDKIDFKKVVPYTLKSGRHILIGSTGDYLSTIQKPDEYARILVWWDNNEVTKVNVIVFNSDFSHTDDFDQIALSLLDNTAKALNGKYTVYNVYQNISFFNEYKNNQLQANGRLKPKGLKNTGGKSSGCTDWYLVTTYSNGYQTWAYLYTTCDCGELDRVSETANCGGGTTVGEIYAPPMDPQQGEQYSYTDDFGAYRIMETSVCLKAVGG